MRNQMTKKKKILTVVIAASVAAAILLTAGTVAGNVALYNLAVSIYDGSFNYRYDTSEEEAFELSDFPTLTRERHTFTSLQGQTLVGYLYEQSDPALEEKAVIVFAHGLGGGGQRGYMDIFDYMTAQGYYVFAYDATANDESEGDVVGGLPQGFIDLDHAIDYAYTVEEIKDLPFLLMGYSWGGLSVVNVLNDHPEVEAVAALAGWNESMNLIDYRGQQMVGGAAKLLLPYAMVYEYVLYGDYSFHTAMKGFAASDCDVMIVHGELDDTIPIGYGYDKYYKKYGDDDRFTFKKYADRDHGVMTTADGELDLALMAEIAAFFDQSLAD